MISLSHGPATVSPHATTARVAAPSPALPVPASNRIASLNGRPSIGGTALDRLELLQRPGKAIASELDLLLLAADEGEAFRLRQQAL